MQPTPTGGIIGPPSLKTPDADRAGEIIGPRPPNTPASAPEPLPLLNGIHSRAVVVVDQDAHPGLYECIAKQGIGGGGGGGGAAAAAATAAGGGGGGGDDGMLVRDMLRLRADAELGGCSGGCLLVEMAVARVDGGSQTTQLRRIVRLHAVPSAVTAISFAHWVVDTLVARCGDDTAARRAPSGVRRTLNAKGEFVQLIRLNGTTPCLVTVPVAGFTGANSDGRGALPSSHVFVHVDRDGRCAPMPVGPDGIDIVSIASGLRSHGVAGVTSFVSRRLLNADAMRIITEYVKFAHRDGVPVLRLRDPFGRATIESSTVTAALLYTVAGMLAENVRFAVDALRAGDESALCDVMRGVNWRGDGAADDVLRVFSLPAPPGARLQHLRAAAQAIVTSVTTAGRRHRARLDSVYERELERLPSLYYTTLVRAMVAPEALQLEISTERDVVRAWAVGAAVVLRQWLGGDGRDVGCGGAGAATVAFPPAVAVAGEPATMRSGVCVATANAVEQTWNNGLQRLADDIFAVSTLERAMLTIRVAPCLPGVGSIGDAAPVYYDDTDLKSLAADSASIYSTSDTSSVGGSGLGYGGGGGSSSVYGRRSRASKRPPPSDVAGASDGTSATALPAAAADDDDVSASTYPLLGCHYFAALRLRHVHAADGGPVQLASTVRNCSVTGRPLAPELWTRDRVLSLRYDDTPAAVGWGGGTTCVFTSLARLRGVQGLLGGGVVFDACTRTLWLTRDDAETLRGAVVPPLRDTASTVAALLTDVPDAAAVVDGFALPGERAALAQRVCVAATRLLRVVIEPPHGADRRSLLFGVHANSISSEGATVCANDTIVLPDCESVALASTIHVEVNVPYASREAGHLVLRPGVERVAEWADAARAAAEILCVDVCPEPSAAWRAALVVPPGAAFDTRVPCVQRALLSALEPFQPHFIAAADLERVSDVALHLVQRVVERIDTLIEVNNCAAGLGKQLDPYCEWSTRADRALHGFVDAVMVFEMPRALSGDVLTGVELNTAIDRYYHSHQYDDDDGGGGGGGAAAGAWAGGGGDREATAERKRRRHLAQQSSAMRRARPPTTGVHLVREAVAPQGHRTYTTSFWRRYFSTLPRAAGGGGGGGVAGTTRATDAYPLPAFFFAGTSAEAIEMPCAVRVARGAGAAVQLARMLRALDDRRDVDVDLADALCRAAWLLFLCVGVTPREKLHRLPEEAHRRHAASTWSPRTDLLNADVTPVHRDGGGGGAAAAAAADQPGVFVAVSRVVPDALQGAATADGVGGGLHAYMDALRSLAGGGGERVAEADSGAPDGMVAVSLPLCCPAIDVHPTTGMQQNTELLASAPLRVQRGDPSSAEVVVSLVPEGPRVRVVPAVVAGGGAAADKRASVARYSPLPGYTSGHVNGPPVPKNPRQYASRGRYTCTSVNDERAADVIRNLPPDVLPLNGCDTGLLRAILNRADHITALAPIEQVEALARAMHGVFNGGDAAAPSSAPVAAAARL